MSNSKELREVNEMAAFFPHALIFVCTRENCSDTVQDNPHFTLTKILVCEDCPISSHTSRFVRTEFVWVKALRVYDTRPGLLCYKLHPQLTQTI
jgi:hypothetical protein